MEKYKITYNEYGELVNLLCNKLTNSSDQFSAVYGLARGGLAIAVHISHQLLLPLVTSLNQIEALYLDKNILVVDDIMTNGKSFTRFIEFAKLKNIKYKTAVLYYKTNSHYTPNYYATEIPVETWITFPWEITESIEE